MQPKWILILALLPQVIWAAGGQHDVKPGCEMVRVYNNRIFPDDIGGSDISKAKKYCDGKTDLYILQLDRHVKCELNNSKIHISLGGEAYIDFPYEYTFKPSVNPEKYETLDYCVSKSSTVEKFKVSNVPDEIKAKLSAVITKAPYNYKITTKMSGSNYDKKWTYLSSTQGTSVSFIAVANKLYKASDNNGTEDWYFSKGENEDIVRENIIIVVLVKDSKVLLVKPVESIGEVYADADGDGFPEVVYKYEDSENSRRDLTDIRP